jgi:KDO2-lipid IV(A) lauroyltransferase
MAKSLREFRHRLAFIVFSFVVFFTKITPRFIGLKLFGFIGLFCGYVLKKERGITQENLKKAFPDYSKKRIEKITNGVFVNAAKSFFDGIKLPEYPKEKFFKILKIDNEELTKKVFGNTNGAVILGSHLSAFELPTHIAALMGFKAMTIGSKAFDEKVDEMLVNLRKRNNVAYFDRDGGIMNVIRNLKKGFAFGVLVDQDATHEGVFVDFFGEEAFTPFIPVKIAIHNKIPLAFSFIIREENDNYRFFLEKSEMVLTENEIETYILNLEKYNKRLEEYIRKKPEQWVWMHKRWKRKTKDFPPELSISYYKKE